MNTPDDYKRQTNERAIQEYRTNSETQPLSACCNYKVVVRVGYGGADYFFCTKCNEVCDLATPEQPKQQSSKTCQLDTPPTSGEKWEKELSDIIQKELRGVMLGTISALGSGAPDPRDKTYVKTLNLTPDIMPKLIDFITSLIRAEREKILEAVKLETAPNQQGETAYLRWFAEGYNKAGKDLNAIREKVKNNI